MQLVAQGLPAGVLVAAGDGIGEQRQGHGPEAAEAGKHLPFIGSGRSVLPLDGCRVRMAAMMSRALAFSPPATVLPGLTLGGSSGVRGWRRELTGGGSFGGVAAVEAADRDGGPSGSRVWPRDAFTRAA